MDMQIDSARVRAERERRAWSQEHLAEVSNVSLRTVQRVEMTGSASYETARAIAASLELQPQDLQLSGAPRGRPNVARLRYAAVAASLLLVCSVAFMRTAHAEDVQIAVSLSRNAENLGDHQLVVAEGKSAEIRLEGRMRLFVNPKVTQEGRILLSMRVEEPSGTRWVEVGEPRLLVESGNKAEVSVTSPKGIAYKISIRPQRS